MGGTKAQTGNKLKLPWTKLGKFFRLQVLNPFIKTNDAAASVIKDAAQLKNFMEGFKLSFNEKFLKEQFGEKPKYSSCKRREIRRNMDTV